MQNEKEVQVLKRRLLDLANTCYYKEYPTYSDFLNLNEQSCFFEIQKELPPVSYCLWGGNELSERRMLCFYTGLDTLETDTFPIRTLCIRPAHLKFAESLTHRDYLGAILNLGIDRCKIGDIMFEEQNAYVFVEESMCEYIRTSLEKVKHTNIICEEAKTDMVFEQKYKDISGTVSSVRLDAVIATAFQSSRSKLLGLISGDKVFVNGRLISSNSYRLKEGDIVSVRGMGKFLYAKEQAQTKKGKTKILLRKYI